MRASRTARLAFPTVALALLCLVVCACWPARAKAQSSETCGLRYTEFHKPHERVSAVAPILDGSLADADLLQALTGSLAYGSAELTRQASALARRSQILALAHGSACGQALALFATGRAVLWTDPKASISSLQAAVEAFQAIHSVSGVATTRLKLGDAYWQLGESAEELAAYTQAEKELRAAGFVAEAVFAKYKLLALSYDGLVPATDLEQLLDQLAPLHSLDADLYRLSMLTGLGATASRQGLFEAAMIHFDAALQVHEACQCGLVQTSRVHDGIGLLELTHGRPEPALGEFTVAGRLLRQSGVSTLSSEFIFHQARAYEDLHRLREAASSYERALASLPPNSHVDYLPYLRSGLGDTYLALGQNSRGLGFLQLAAGTAETDQARCIANDNLGEAYLRSGALAGAERQLSLAVESCRHGDDKDLLAETYALRARVRLQLADTDGALNDVAEAQKNAELYRQHLVPLDAFKRGFEHRVPVYDIAVEVLAAAHRDTDALAAAEQAHGRAFLDLLETQRDKSPATRTENTTVRDGALASAGHVEALDVLQMAASLQRLHSTLLNYWVTRSAIYLWVLAPGKPVVMRTTALRPGELDRLIRSTNTPPPLGRPHVSATSDLAWRRLYQLLIAPAESELPSRPGSLLTIVQHGPLFRVSFAALRDARGRYLLERYAIHTTPSVGVLRYTAANDATADSSAPHYLLVGNPARLPANVDGKPLPALPGTGVEIHAIAAVLPAKQVTLLEGSQAGIDELKLRLGEATMLHIASHAIVSDSDPLRSFVALDRSQSGGLLSASDVYRLSLHTHLVVLSACRTALGEITGDGVAGLSRGFFYAGSASLMNTLWDLPDATSDRLLVALYRSLERGESRSAALRSAQLDMLAALRKKHVIVNTLRGSVSLAEDPFYWAAFSLVGEP